MIHLVIRPVCFEWALRQWLLPLRLLSLLPRVLAKPVLPTLLLLLPLLQQLLLLRYYPISMVSFL